MLPDWALHFRSPLDVPWQYAAWALVLAALLLSVALYVRAAARRPARRRAALLGLRCVALGALAWMLAGPITFEPASAPDLRDAPLWLLIDTSASMAERDVSAPGGATGERISRFSALRRTWLTDDQLDAWRARVDLRLLSFAENVQPIPPDPPDPPDAANSPDTLDSLDALRPAGRATHLYEAIEQARQSAGAAHDSPTVLAVLSDGHDTQRERDAALLEALGRSGMTVHVVPVGEANASPTLTMQAWSDADHLFANQSTTLHAALRHHQLVGRLVQVELWHDSRRIESRTLTLDELPGQTVSFRITPPAPVDAPLAVHAYELRAQVIEEESAARERDAVEPALRSVFVQVSAERMRVAMLEGEPHWETRFLARLLRSDPRIELTSVHRLGEQRVLSIGPGGEAVDASAVATPAWLNRFDVVVLGQRMERFFPGESANVLVDYVQQRGGAVVLARGRPFDGQSEAGRAAMARFDAIAPVRWTDDAPATNLHLTAAQQDHALLTEGGWSMLDELPGMLAATPAQEKPAAVVLLRQSADVDDARDMAALVQLRAGRGQVLAVLTEGLWQWAMLPRRLEQHAGVYERFWSRSIHWLATGGAFLPGQDVSLLLSPMTVEPGATVRASVETRYLPEQPFEPTLRITSPDGQVRTLRLAPDAAQPTRHHASFVPRVVGVHQVALFDAADGDVIAADAPILRQLIVEDRSPERQDTAARPRALHALAAASGGRVFALHEADQLLAHVAAGQTQRQQRTEPTARDAFARWPMLLLVLASLTLEWWLRRRSEGW